MDARLVIGGVLGIAALAWILTKSQGSATLLATIGDTFAALVKPLFPSG
jgi:hypothetical protein